MARPALTPLDIVEQKTELQTCEREHRTALVALDEIAQQAGKQRVYQKRGNIFFRADAQHVGPRLPELCVAGCAGFRGRVYGVPCGRASWRRQRC